MPIRDERMTRPVQKITLSNDPNSHRAQSVHQQTHRSETLNRRYVKKTVIAQAAAPRAEVAPVARNAMSGMKVRTAAHPKISKFAPHPADIAVKKAIAPQPVDIQPMAHPVAKRAYAEQAARVAAPVSILKPSQILKREAEVKALAEAMPSSKRVRNKSKAKQTRPARFLSFMTAGASLLLLGGYFTYINMPNLSVRVAAAQAGIEAEYPAYRPSGYSLSGPIAYDSGTVSMKFAMNGTPKSFTLNQARSGWDSSAVLDNYIQPKAGSAYTTTQDSGLTIYSFGNNAAWVNNGIMYTVEGDAPISLEQIRRIATSM